MRRLWIPVLLALVLVFVALISLYVRPEYNQAKYLYDIGRTQAQLSMKDAHPGGCVSSGGWAAPNTAALFLLNYGEYNAYKEAGWLFVIDEEALDSVPMHRITSIQDFCKP